MLPGVTDGPLCVFCGSEFPVELERCPTCGRPWIDQRLAEVAEGAVVPIGDVSAAAEPPIDTEPARRIPLWLITGGVALVALMVYGIVFSFLLDDDGDGPVAAPSSSTVDSTSAPPASTTSMVPSTTEGPGPTTTTTPTTTSTSTSTTTTTTTTLPPIAEGTPIPISDMTLGAFGLGPLQIGSNGATALERLAATFGQPTALTELTGGEAGICETQVGRAVRFGWVTAIVVGEPGTDGTFAGYLYDEGPTGHPAEGLKTISGAQLGDTLAEVDTLYVGPDIAVGDIDGTPHLFVLRSSDQRTLLWGPLSGTGDDAVLEGINAPYLCDDGPFAP